jgi:hypothetical protein
MSLDKRLKSKWWRLNHLYKIKSKSGALITFKPNVIQRAYYVDRGAHRYNAILKARQHGITTEACIDLLDEALWVPGMGCAVIAHERVALDEIFQIVKRGFVNLPDQLKPETKTDTLRMYRFTNRFDGYPLDSSIYVALKLRSGTVQRLHISESAFIKDRAELVAGSKQAVPKTGRITEETTGNGFNEFYDFYMEQHQKPTLGPMDYKTHFFAWFENPEYTLPGVLPTEDKTADEITLQTNHGITDGQLLWRRWKMTELRAASVGEGLTSEQLFKQEYPSTIIEAFQSGAGAVFDASKIDQVRVRMPLVNPTHTMQQQLDALRQLGFRFWHLPQPDAKYDIGVDPSDGEGADFSCIDVWGDIEGTYRQCAQYYGKLRPDELAEVTKQVAEFYNRAFVGVENNMLTTILFLTKIYDNYYYDTRIDERTNKRTKKIGWNTNIKTRDVMIDEFIIHFDENHLEINSPITLGEMRTFVKKPNGKREHADGKHDDALFAGMITLQMRKLKPKPARVFAINPLQ